MMRCPDSVYRQALRLAVPMMIQNGITNAVSLVDNLMVGSLGTESMTAVSISGNLLFVFSLAVFGGLSGPGIYGVQYYGQKNEDGVRDVFRLKWLIMLTIALAGISTFLFFGRDLLLLYLRGETAGIDAGLTLSLASEYLSVMLIGLMPFGITQIYAGSLRETGESVKPMIAGLGSVTTDVVFNYLLIYGKLGFPALGVRGAAIATVISRFIELSIIVMWAHLAADRHTFLRGVYRKMTVPWLWAKKVILKGLPIFLNEFLWAGGMAFITQCFSLRGLALIAGANIANALCNLFNVAFIAMGNAVGIITGQKLGACDFENAKKDAVKLMRFSSLASVSLTAILIAGARFFPLLYNTTDDVRQIGTMVIIIYALFFPVDGFLNALYFTLRSGGRTFITFLFDSVFTWVLPVPLAFILCRFTSLSAYLVLFILQSCSFVKMAVGLFMFHKDIWVQNLVEVKPN